MARADPAFRLRVPAEARRRTAERRAAEPAEPSRPRLRLVVTKGRLGVELEQPLELGPVRVGELALSLPDVKFPVELSGGVDAFRNRRGQLERVLVEVGGSRLAQWGAPRLRGLFGDAIPRLVAAPLEDGFLLGLSTDRSALAFEVVVAPLDGDVRLLPTAARGAGLDAPPQALAARVLGALLRPLGKLVGGAVVLEDAAGVVSRHLLPLAGMRAAATHGLRWHAPELDIGLVRMLGEFGATPAALGERVVRSIELAALVADAEEALLRGDLDAARRRYLGALEQAPRHPEVTRRLAELDACVGGRAEAALGTLTDAMLAIDAGLLGGRLLRQVGDEDGARVALRRAAEQEVFGPLAAMTWLELAALSHEPSHRAEALDNAVSRAPMLDAARWQRFEARLRAGDLRGMRDDVGHLEQQASGSVRRHAVVRRAAGLLLRQGLAEHAAEWFERALRYVPDSTDAVAGLARSLQGVGRHRRALDLLGRAVALAERAQRPAHAARLDLARALVDVADDRPAAVAHVRAVPPFVPETFEARLLEARWRSELGDLAGADVALGQLADAVEQAQEVLVQDEPTRPSPYRAVWGERARWPTRADARAAVAALVVEGARIQELDRQDLRAAQRLLGLALRLSPRDHSIRQLFRHVCASLDAAAQPTAAPPRAAAQTGQEQDGVPSRAEITTERPPPTIPSSPGSRSAPRSQPVTVEASPSRARPMPPEPSVPIAAAPSATDAAAADEETGGRGAEDVMPPVRLSSPTASAFELGEPSDGGDEALIEALTNKLRADPSDLDTVRKLASLLERGRKDHDLLALLSARIDEGPESLRDEFVRKRRVVLERLLVAARQAGKESEAELYLLMLERND